MFAITNTAQISVDYIIINTGHDRSMLYFKLKCVFKVDTITLDIITPIMSILVHITIRLNVYNAVFICSRPSIGGQESEYSAEFEE